MDAERDEAEQRLKEALAGIESAADDIASGRAALDPDAVEAALDSRAAAASDALEELMSDLTGAPDENGRLPIDLADAIRAAVGTELAACDVSVVVTTRTEGPLEPLHGDPIRLPAALCRLVRLALRHAGNGGEVDILVHGQRDELCVDMRAESTEPPADDEEAAETMQLAAATARDFVAALGGELDIETTAAGLGMAMRMPQRVAR